MKNNCHNLNFNNRNKSKNNHCLLVKVKINRITIKFQKKKQNKNNKLHINLISINYNKKVKKMSKFKKNISMMTLLTIYILISKANNYSNNQYNRRMFWMILISFIISTSVDKYLSQTNSLNKMSYTYSTC